jgi:hypothetical protein
MAKFMMVEIRLEQTTEGQTKIERERDRPKEK